MTWKPPPDELYTFTQLRQRRADLEAKLRERTIGRSDASIAEAAQMLQELMCSPVQSDLAVNLIWALDSSRVQHVVKPGTMAEMVWEIRAMHGAWRRGDVLVWNQHGLFVSYNLAAPFRSDMVKLAGSLSAAPVSPVELERLCELVHKFQIMPTQVEYLRKVLTMSHRPRNT